VERQPYRRKPISGPVIPGGPEITDDTELHKLTDDVNEIEKVAAEMKAARRRTANLARRCGPSSTARNAVARA
jgi:hypothetical protein